MTPRFSALINGCFERTTTCGRWRRPGRRFAVLAVERFDVILCDVNLPGMSGPLFFEKLSPLHATRTIFVTGGSCDNMKFLAEHPLLLKPFTAEELLAAMKKVVDTAPP